MIKRIPTIVFGAAGGAKDVYYWLKAANNVTQDEYYDVLGLIDSNEELQGKILFDGIQVIGKDEDVPNLIKNIERVALIVPFGDPYLRGKVVNKMNSLGNIYFPNIIHPSVIYDSEAGTMGNGNYIGPGVVIASEFTIGDHNYINTGVCFGHDIKMGCFNSINPAASCAGNVVFGNYNTLSINAAVIEETTIGDGIIIGGGAIVTKDILESGTYVGVPVRKIK